MCSEGGVKWSSKGRKVDLTDMGEQLKGGSPDLSAQVEAVQRQNQSLWQINRVVWNFTKAADQDVDEPNDELIMWILYLLLFFYW